MLDHSDDLVRRLLDECVAEATMADAALDTVLDLRDDGPASWTRLVGSLRHALAVGASDLHVKAGARPRVRVAGHLSPVPVAVFDAVDCDRLAARIVPPRLAATFASGGEVDVRLCLPELGGRAFRVNVFRTDATVALAVRILPEEVPHADELGLLPVVRDLAGLRSGLVLVAGRAGAGKSTTLAWMVDRINATRPATIVTVEDPIEYRHRDRLSMVHQREVGSDTPSVSSALRHLLRQDPDVVVLGEVRDTETARAALGAARSGHLVLATIHADDAPGAIDRFVGLFPPGAQAEARRSLADGLRAVVAQRLVERRGDRTRVLAQEVLLATGRTTECIARPDDPGPTLGDLVAIGGHVGMCSFDQHLAALVRSGRLGAADARAAATEASDLLLGLVGDAAAVAPVAP